MKLNTLLIGGALLISGCVTVKAPENLISDSVRAGRELYHSVKNEASDNETNLFSFSYHVPENESYAESSSKCIDRATEKAKKTLNKYQIDIKKTESKVVVENGKKIFNCSVSI